MDDFYDDSPVEMSANEKTLIRFAVINFWALSALAVREHLTLDQVLLVMGQVIGSIDGSQIGADERRIMAALYGEMRQVIVDSIDEPQEAQQFLAEFKQLLNSSPV